MMTSVMTMTNTVHTNEQWQPIAYVTMRDGAARSRITDVLERAGWTVIPQPTGFHLIQAIAGVIEGQPAWFRPGLIVIDARSHGCAGTTIAAGLRELGIAIPIVLIAAPGEALPVSSDDTLRIVDGASAEAAVTELAQTASRPVGVSSAATGPPHGSTHSLVTERMRSVLSTFASLV